MKKIIRNVLLIIIIFIAYLCIFKINVYAANEDSNKNIKNGIYKIAVGRDLNKALELPGGNKSNNAQLGIWDYRKRITSKILYRISNRWIL